MQLKGKGISFFLGAKEAKHKPSHKMIYSLFMYILSPEESDWKFMEGYEQCTEQCYFQHLNSWSLAV